MRNVFWGNQYRSTIKNQIKSGIKKGFLLSLILTISGWLIYGGISYERFTAKPKIVKAEVKVEIAVDSPSPVMDRIAKCESGNSHISKNGQVVIKVNTNGTTDVGLYQINSVWNEQATKLGYNLTIESDNKAFAMWLYKNKGTEPWYSSVNCWSK